MSLEPLANHPATAAQDDDLGALSSQETEVLLTAVRGGSGEALGTLMDACRRYLLLVARAELGEDLQAKVGASDLVQETFLQAQKNFARFDGTSPTQLRAWLRQILLHRLAGVTRDFRQRRKRRVSQERPLDLAGLHRRSHRLLPARAASPSQHAVAQEEHERLERALARLPAGYYRVIVLRNRERRSFAEIGELLNLSSGAVRKLWVRGLVRLQRELAEPSAPRPLPPRP